MKKALPKAGELPLGRYILAYRNGSPLFTVDNDVIYLAEGREVRFRVLFPGGIGYCTVKVPDTVRTLDGVLKLLESTGDFTLKEEVTRPKGLKGLWERVFGK